MSTTTSFFSLNDRPFGKSYEDWTAEWWKAYTFQGWRRAIGKVYHVPGTVVEREYDPSAGHRMFNIKHDKAILLSVINWLQPEKADQWKINSKNPFMREQLGQSARSLSQLAVYRMDLAQPDLFNFLIDGAAVQPDAICRARTEFKLFSVNSASDGFWIFIKPGGLAKGKHQISTFGCCTSGRVKLAMDYDINIH